MRPEGQREYSFDELAEAPATSGIYLIRNRKAGRVYVGSAMNFRRRWNLHCSQLRSGKHHSPPLQQSFLKHGESEFCFQVLDVVEYAGDIVVREQEYLDRFKSSDMRFGYNCCPTAGSKLGIKHSESTRAKMSESHRRRCSDPSELAKFHAVNRERWAKPESKSKHGEAMRKACESPERRKKMGEIVSSLWKDPKFRKKAVASKLGKKHSPETKAKMRESHRRNRDKRDADYAAMLVNYFLIPLLGWRPHELE